MHACPDCGHSMESSRFIGPHASCPACGGILRPQDDADCVDVARVSNLAEAGFLTDELNGLGIHAQIHQQQDFSAVTNSWSSLYLIRVPAERGSEAAAAIRQHLADDLDREADCDGYRFTVQNQAMDPLVWRPVALVILAGVSSFVLGQRFSEHNDAKAERRVLRDSLASAVDAIDRPFVSTSDRGPTYRLSFDRQRQSWLLETDRDRDGRYDKRQAFPATGARW